MHKINQNIANNKRRVAFFLTHSLHTPAISLTFLYQVEDNFSTQDNASRGRYKGIAGRGDAALSSIIVLFIAMVFIDAVALWLEWQFGAEHALEVLDALLA